MITVVLVRPEHPGNIGAVARAMANFDFQKLVLINPACNHLDEEAKKRAKHAQHVLEHARVAGYDELKKYSHVIGTTAQTGTEYNIARSPLTPEEAAQRAHKEASIALVFGSEGTGLTNDELKHCDYTITIPTSKEYGTLNLSHAVSIVLYEFFTTTTPQEPHTPASADDIRTIHRFGNDVLDSLSFPTPEKKETQQLVWKKIFAKATLTKREAFAVLGLLKNLLGKR